MATMRSRKREWLRMLIFCLTASGPESGACLRACHRLQIRSIAGKFEEKSGFHPLQGNYHRAGFRCAQGSAFVIDSPCEMAKGKEPSPRRRPGSSFWISAVVAGVSIVKRMQDKDSSNPNSSSRSIESSMVASGEAFDGAVSVLPDTFDEVGGDADVEGAVVVAGKEVDAGLLHASSMVWSLQAGSRPSPG